MSNNNISFFSSILEDEFDLFLKITVEENNCKKIKETQIQSIDDNTEISGMILKEDSKKVEIQKKVSFDLVFKDKKRDKFFNTVSDAFVLLHNMSNSFITYGIIENKLQQYGLFNFNELINNEPVKIIIEKLFEDFSEKIEQTGVIINPQIVVSKQAELEFNDLVISFQLFSNIKDNFFE